MNRGAPARGSHEQGKPAATPQPPADAPFRGTGFACRDCRALVPTDTVRRRVRFAPAAVPAADRRRLDTSGVDRQPGAARQLDPVVVSIYRTLAGSAGEMAIHCQRTSSRKPSNSPVRVPYSRCWVSSCSRAWLSAASSRSGSVTTRSGRLPYAGPGAGAPHRAADRSASWPDACRRAAGFSRRTSAGSNRSHFRAVSPSTSTRTLRQQISDNAKGAAPCG